jgi:hypothetical protein
LSDLGLGLHNLGLTMSEHHLWVLGLGWLDLGLGLEQWIGLDRRLKLLGHGFLLHLRLG